MCVCAHLYLCVQMCAHLYVSMRGVGVYRWGVHGCTQMCDTPVYVGVGIYMCACECVCVCAQAVRKQEFGANKGFVLSHQ